MVSSDAAFASNTISIKSVFESVSTSLVKALNGLYTHEFNIDGATQFFTTALGLILALGLLVVIVGACIWFAMTISSLLMMISVLPIILVLRYLDEQKPKSDELRRLDAFNRHFDRFERPLQAFWFIAVFAAELYFVVHWLFL